MPTVDAFRRAPLVSPAFVPLPDSAVQVGGTLQALTAQVLSMADVAAMAPLDAVLASKLGGYADLPPMPNIEAAASELHQDPKGFISCARAALLTASATGDKAAMLRLLTAMRTFEEALPTLSEDVLLAIGADALRVTDELYRRTGQSFLLSILERLRAQLPDVSGLMHSFPFVRAYQPEDTATDTETAEYHHRMKRLATGSLTADALSMTALLALVSGSGRDGAACKAGLTALIRYHGLPSGAFSADPYLAGRDPARAVDLPSACAQAEAYADILAASGDLTFAGRLEMLLANVLPGLIAPQGAHAMQPVSRLPQDDSCATAPLTPEDTSALLRALHALRRSLWAAREANEIALLLPLSGGCLTRVNGMPVRLISEATGTYDRTITITVEAKQPTAFTLLLRIPAYATEATVAIGGGKPQATAPGTLHAVERTFRTGDTVTLRIVSMPRLEPGYRGSVSVLCGPTLMALPMPNASAGWQYALLEDTLLTPAEENGTLLVYATGTDAPGWATKAGFVTPPPQGLPAGAEYELTLLPFAGTTGRIAAFPRAARRA